MGAACALKRMLGLGRSESVVRRRALRLPVKDGARNRRAIKCYPSGLSVAEAPTGRLDLRLSSYVELETVVYMWSVFLWPLEEATSGKSTKQTYGVRWCRRRPHSSGNERTVCH